MTRSLLAILSLLLLAPSACRRARSIDVDTEGAEKIPTGIAVSRLNEIIPNAFRIEATKPAMKAVPKGLEELTIDDELMRFRRAKSKNTVSLAYSDITKVELGQYGGYFGVYLYSQVVGGALHVRIWFRDKSTAEEVVELVDSLRRKGTH